jgi:MFS family permease
MIGSGIIAPLMGIYAEMLDVHGIQLGFFFASFPLARIISGPWIGKWSDYSGRKIFILIGFCFYTILSLGYTIGDSIGSLTLVRFLHGVAGGMIVPIALAYIGEIAPENQEGKYMSTFVISLFLGMGFGPLISGVLTDIYGMNSGFYIMAGMSALMVIFILKFLPEDSSQIVVRKEPLPFNKILPHPMIKALIIFRCVNAIALSTFMSFLPIFAISLEISIAQIGIVISINIIVTAISQRLFGSVADRFDKNRLILLGCVVMGSLLFIIPFAYNFKQLLIISIIIGLGRAIALPASMAITTKLGKEKGMGSVIGLLSTAMNVGMVLGPVISGVVNDLININFVFFVTSIIIFLATIIFFFLTKNID